MQAIKLNSQNVWFIDPEGIRFVLRMKAARLFLPGTLLYANARRNPFNNRQMENNQQRPSSENPTQGQNAKKTAPGQQLPVGSQTLNDGSLPTEKERHSESSLPQQDNETLGTP